MLSAKKRLWIEILLHLVFWAGVFYTLTSLNSSHIHVWAKTGHVVSDQYENTSISSYVYLILIFLAVLFYGNICWVFSKAIRFKSIMVRLAACAGWFLLVFGANYFTVGPLFDNANHAIEPTPMPRPVFQKHDFIELDHITRLRRSDGPDPVRVDAVNFMISSWQHLQPVILLAFLTILGISIAYFFLKEWAKSELIQTQMQANQLSTELRFLKSQINPHFLFNTLNNLFSLAQREGKGNLADKIAKLSGMMRYMIYESNTDSVPLASEISYLEDCIALHQMRYAGKEAEVTLQYPEPATVAVVQVAPMLFIPFLENAFKHGVAIGRDSSIALAISVNLKKLVFTCENMDHSAVKKLEEEKGGIGLENVKRRLELVYPGRHELRTSHEDGKYIVNLQIDLP